MIYTHGIRIIYEDARRRKSIARFEPKNFTVPFQSCNLTNA